MWVKNTKGKQDAALTFALGGCVLVATKVLFGGTDLLWGPVHFVVAPIDAASIAAVLTPTLGAYVARRHSERASG
jgi:hypothetical protein